MLLGTELLTILALDVGEARIGVAVGQMGSSFAFGRGFITCQEEQANINTIKDKVKQEGAELIVVGLPLCLRGNDSAQTKRVRVFAKALEATGLKIVFEDERLSSKLAAQKIHYSNLPKKKRQEKGRLDEIAAVLILESYLAKQNGNN